MRTCKEIIESAEKAYIECADVDKLSAAVAEVDEAIAAGRPTGDNLRRADALSYCIKAKVLTIQYLSSDYSPEAYDEIMSYIAVSLDKLATTDYENTIRTFAELRGLIFAINEMMKDAVELVYQVRDTDGGLATSSVELLSQILEAFKRKQVAANDLGDTSSVFGKWIKMPDIGGRVRDDIGEVCDWIEKNLFALRTKSTEEFFKQYTHPLSDEPLECGIEYHPALSKNDNSTARATVLMSPLHDEVVLFARAYAKENSREFTVIDSRGFSDKDDAFIDAVFESLSNAKLDALIFGLTEYHAPNAEHLLETIIRYTLGGRIAFPHDGKGDKLLYDSFYKITKEKTGLTGLDVSYRYLLLPSFAEVSGELEEKGAISPSDHAFLREKMAFMGYVGFNRAVLLFVQGKKWRDEVMEISDRHEIESQRYLSNIPTQAQLLDPSWRTIDLVRDQEKPKREFDYDSIRTVNPKNIKTILEANISLHAKCGMIARYCALHGDDISIWNNLTVEEKSARLTDATRLVAHLLQNQYEPEVEVIAEENWHNKRAGGFCCDGGKRIVYREKCCRDYSWTIKAICHECFHGFQHTLENNGWLPWHWDELGVTKNRVNEWTYNTSNYRAIEKNFTVYMIQIIESDARAFEMDCYEQSEAVYNTINLE